MGCLAVLIGVGAFFFLAGRDRSRTSSERAAGSDDSRTTDVKSSSSVGKLLLRIEPEKAAVHLDGSLITASCPKEMVIDVAKGAHKLSVTKDGFDPADRTVDVTAGSTKILEVTLEPDPRRWPFSCRYGSVRNKLLREGGGNAQSEAAVALGLEWIVKQQKPDGGWHAWGRESLPAHTAYGLLPLLSAGHTHKEGKYARNVKDGLAYLLGKQKGDGDFGDRSTWAHGEAANAVCEAFGMTQDDWLKVPAQRAVDFITKTQNSAGGWDTEKGETAHTETYGRQIRR